MIHAQCNHERGGTWASVEVEKKGCPVGCSGAQELSRGVEILQFYASMQLLRSSRIQLQGAAGQEGRREAAQLYATTQTLLPHGFSSRGEPWVMLSRTPL